MAEVDIKRVQNKLLDMAKRIAFILEKHDIPYMIAYGTLLGAIRHNGFIPWDDDFDFYLFDESYDTAMEYLRTELPNNMFLEDEKSEPLYFHSWAHVKDVNSIANCKEFPQDSLYAHKGISVDLYRTKKMKLSELESFLNDENEAYINRRLKNKLITTNEYNERIKKLNERRTFIKENPETRDNIVYNLVPVYKCHSINEGDIFPLKKYSFENNVFLGPNNAEKILTMIYGDYMKLPPLEKRVCHYSIVEFK